MNAEVKSIIIYDGVCYFCNRAVQFIITRDPGGKFLFAPMQSNFAQSQIETYCPDQLGIDTFILIKDNRAWLWSSAALEVLKNLNSAWRWLLILKYIPAKIRDNIYQRFARNRYSLFGRSDVCVIPNAEIRERFVGFEHD